MNNDLLLLIKKHTDTLIHQTKTKPQETLEFKMNKQTQVFFVQPTNKLSRRGQMVISSEFVRVYKFCF